MKLDRTKPEGTFVTEPDDDLIICRCEEITKGEIRRAIYDGMYTMTELKRFTRAGMGLCQGGTCSLTVRRVLAKELGLPLREIEEDTSRSPARPMEVRKYEHGGDEA